MITRFLCWLFGHKFWQKATCYPDGLDVSTTEPWRAVTLRVYRWERQPFCLRCGLEQGERQF